MERRSLSPSMQEVSVLHIPTEEVLPLQMEEVQTLQINEAFILPWRRFLSSNTEQVLTFQQGILPPTHIEGVHIPTQGVSESLFLHMVAVPVSQKQEALTSLEGGLLPSHLPHGGILHHHPC